MKKILTHILILVMILAGISAVVTPQVAHAQDTLSSISTMLMSFTGSTLTTFFFYTGGIVLNLSNKLLYISGTLLNAALNETIHLSDLVKNVPAIELTWRTVRDFSSIFFIFFLLYGSIATILGLEGRISPKKLIVNIVIWGILMNFSLFFTKVIIDASNVVTLGFYNAIAPDNVSGGGTSADGGISNIFAQQLRVVTQWDPRGAQKAIKGNFEAKAGPAMWLGSAVMFIAAGSFFVVTLMLIIRIALLILLMAFSPVYFISRILPQTSKLGDSWLSMLSGQVLFAPAYLAVIYIVMKIVSSPTFSSMLMAGDTRSSFSQAFIDGGAPGVIMNYIIVIVLLNAALVVATKFGGHSYKYASEGIKLLKKHGATVTGASMVGRNTLGWGAKNITDSNTFKNFATNHPSLGLFTNKQLGKVASSSFGGAKGGYKKAFDEKVKARTEFAKKGLGEDKTIVDPAEKSLKEHQEKIVELRRQKETAEKEARGKGPNAEGAATFAQNKQYEINDMVAQESKLKDELKKAKQFRQNKFAENLEKKRWKIFTSSMRKEAAKKIKDELNKGKDKKALDTLKDLMKDEAGGDKEKEKKEEH